MIRRHFNFVGRAWYDFEMTPKISSQQRDALRREFGKPLRVEDDVTQKVYVVIEEGLLPTVWEDYIRREVERGLAAVDRGEVEAWDVESIKAEGRHMLEQRSRQS